MPSPWTRELFYRSNVDVTVEWIGQELLSGRQPSLNRNRASPDGLFVTSLRPSIDGLFVPLSTFVALVSNSLAESIALELRAIDGCGRYK